jgi:hypothetical protein
MSVAGLAGGARQDGAARAAKDGILSIFAKKKQGAC